MRSPLARVLALVAALSASVALLAVPATARSAQTSPLDSSFYHYSGSTPLARIDPGTVLKTRTVAYHIAGLALPLKAVQLLYRSTNQLGKPTVAVTTVVRPAHGGSPAKVVSYQSFYDSLNPADEPSVAIAGGTGFGDGIAYVETTLFAPLLLAGYTINIPDTEGQEADFADGPVYGMTTLDSLRAISQASATGVSAKAKIGLLGYSGGAIATEWAAELAHSYAPGVAKRIVGSAAGGVLVDPDHNLHYINGSLVWAGVMPMALIGLARGFHADLTPYVSAYGAKVMKTLENASITSALGHYPGLTWAKLAKPRYSIPESVPVFVKIANQIIMGTGGTPTAPLFLGQGTGGVEEGTPGVGEGDGVMVAGDVRSLAHEYCSRGVRVEYHQYTGLSHVGGATRWLPQAYSWLLARFAGTKAPANCGSIAPGNPLTPVKLVK